MTDDPLSYTQAVQTADRLLMQIRSQALAPVVEAAFERDRGTELRQTLPGDHEPYRFESHGFEADVFPGDRTVTNYVYDGVGLTVDALLAATLDLTALVQDGRQMWREAFADPERHRHDPSHPGPYPLTETTFQTAQRQLGRLRSTVTEEPSMETLVALATDQRVRLLGAVFGVGTEEIYTPGGTDLSALVGVDEFTVAYEDRSLALLNPHQPARRRFDRPVRGVVLGFDDTPVGVFAHVVDTTALAPQTTVSRAQIADAMGFDRQLDPYDLPDSLQVKVGERVRLQGDLRLVAVAEPTGYEQMYANRVRRQESLALLDDLFADRTLPEAVTNRETTVAEVFDWEVSTDGDVALEPLIQDRRAVAVALAALETSLAVGRLAGVTDYADIGYIHTSSSSGRVLAADDSPRTVTTALERVETAAEQHLRDNQQSIDEQVRAARSEMETALSVKRQANIPVDNHFVMVESGFVSDTDREPVFTVVDRKTTVHVGHAEHNTVNVQIPPGVYEFGLLPRGLRRPDNRPNWEG